MLLSAREISAGYGKIHIIRNVSFDLDRGETLALLGRNGMGKTTLLRALVGLADRFSGDLQIDEQSLPPRDPGAFARRGITFVPDDRGVFSRLTVAENIRLARHVAHADCSMDIYDLFPSLKTLVGQLAGTLSGGQQQQLAIARALSTGPRLLIIDELSQGLQPSVVQNLTNALIAASREKGIALIVVDQNPELAMRICDRVMVMKGGEVAAAGQSTVVGSDPDFLNLLIV